jgi:hypothetical protein
MCNHVFISLKYLIHKIGSAIVKSKTLKQDLVSYLIWYVRNGCVSFSVNFSFIEILQIFFVKNSQFTHSYAIVLFDESPAKEASVCKI